MQLNANGISIDLRPGTVDDVPLLLSFMRSMAEFEKLECTATEGSLRDALFGDTPAAHTIVVSVGGEPVGYIVYFFSFATSVGRRCLWMDDLYVVPEFRGKGLGKALLSYMAEFAVKNDCARFEWIVLDWNEPAIGLYRSIGAEMLNDWRICRLEGEALRRAGGTSNSER